MLIDSHAHLNFGEFQDRWQSVAADCLANDTWVINVGAQYQTSRQGIVIAENFPQGMYAAVGLHPIHVLGGDFKPEEFLPEKYQSLVASSKKVVAIGETGVDFFHSDHNFAKQKEIFIEQINLARKNNLALIVHGRNSRDGSQNAYQAILEILKQTKASRGVIHCFGGTKEEDQSFIDLGFFVGFTGIVTFKNAKELQAVAARLPLEKILIETDSPYLAPEPFRSQPNQPKYVKYVAEKIAALKDISYQAVAETTSQNAIKLFGLD